MWAIAQQLGPTKHVSMAFGPMHRVAEKPAKGVTAIGYTVSFTLKSPKRNVSALLAGSSLGQAPPRRCSRSQAPRIHRCQQQRSPWRSATWRTGSSPMQRADEPRRRCVEMPRGACPVNTRARTDRPTAPNSPGKPMIPLIVRAVSGYLPDGFARKSTDIATEQQLRRASRRDHNTRSDCLAPAGIDGLRSSACGRHRPARALAPVA